MTLHVLIASLETDIRSRLVPTIERRRAELQELRRKVTDARQHQLDGERSAAMADLEQRLEQQDHELNTLRAAHRAACDDVAALRSSASWRLTAPARRLYALLLRFRPGTRT
ncbi:MAG: hypothetical protein H0X67_01245 [Acidobacteria bacterium]|nr:hypothetical protein [Acidobacteriota bacterium]